MSVALRPYQQDASAAVLRELETRRSTLALLATGLGKTEIACDLMRRWEHNAIFIVDRKKLVNQAADRIQRRLGFWPGVEMADHYARGTERVVVASTMTLTKARRLRKYRPDRPTLIVIDEADAAVTPSMRSILAHFTAAKVVGLTATADRADGVGLDNVFETVAYQYDLEDAIPDRWLVPFDIRRYFITGINISDVDADSRDLVASQLDAETTRDKDTVKALVKKTREYAGTRRTLVFAAGTNSAKLGTDVFNGIEAGSARLVLGTMDEDEQEAIFADYRSGRFQFLVAVMVPARGYDEPGIRCIALWRMTKSRSLLAQFLGRGGRPLDGILRADMTLEQRRAAIAESGKPDCLVIDFTGNTGRHNLATPLDVLAGRELPEIRAKAAEFMERRGLSMEQAMALAKKNAAEARAREEERERVRRQRIHVQGFEVRVDPFVPRADVEGVDKPLEAKPLTTKQRAVLQYAGFDVDAINPAYAKRLIATIFATGEPNLRGLTEWERGRWATYATQMSRQRDVDTLRAWGAQKAEEIQRFCPDSPNLYHTLQETFRGRRDVLHKQARKQVAA